MKMGNTYQTYCRIKAQKSSWKPDREKAVGTITKPKKLSFVLLENGKIEFISQEEGLAGRGKMAHMAPEIPNFTAHQQSHKYGNAWVKTSQTGLTCTSSVDRKEGFTLYYIVRYLENPLRMSYTLR